MDRTLPKHVPQHLKWRMRRARGGSYAHINVRITTTSLVLPSPMTSPSATMACPYPADLKAPATSSMRTMIDEYKNRMERLGGPRKLERWSKSDVLGALDSGKGCQEMMFGVSFHCLF